jgi:phosphoglycolate phosphatase
LVARSLEAAGGDGADFERALARFLHRYEDHLLDETRPYDGMVAALDALRAGGARLSVLTNKPGPLARKLLAGLGIADRFAVVVGGEEGYPPKPDPTGAERVIARSGIEAAATVFVGDSPVDVRTARAARAAACAVSWGFSTRDALREAAPDLLIDEPAALVR